MQAAWPDAATGYLHGDPAVHPLPVPDVGRAIDRVARQVLILYEDEAEGIIAQRRAIRSGRIRVLQHGEAERHWESMADDHFRCFPVAAPTFLGPDRLPAGDGMVQAGRQLLWCRVPLVLEGGFVSAVREEDGVSAHVHLEPCAHGAGVAVLVPRERESALTFNTFAKLLLKAAMLEMPGCEVRLSASELSAAVRRARARAREVDGRIRMILGRHLGRDGTGLE